MFGFVRFSAAVPRLRLADVRANRDEVFRLVEEAETDGVSVLVFPELCLTGYTCGDLFFQSRLLEDAEEAILDIAKRSRQMRIAFVVGSPFLHADRLYNCGFVIQGGKIRGVVPKTHLPNYREFYERRWFSSGAGISDSEIMIGNHATHFGTSLLFQLGKGCRFGIEICEDLWSVIPPSSHQALAGASVFLNLSASNELVGKAEYRRDLVRQQSARCMGAYVYASSGIGESTTDTVYGGGAMIAENGVILAENQRFSPASGLLTADIDCERLSHLRIAEGPFRDSGTGTFTIVELDPGNPIPTIRRSFDPHPFVPSDPETRTKRCEEIFQIQTTGFARRIEHTNSKRAVIGVSGGLDSTLALLVAVRSLERLGRPPGDVLAITMPGFGTTDRTRGNAAKLCRFLGVECRTIPIREACLRHFRDIGHDSEVYDTTYENVQARERTQILMDIANREHGLVVGTGDLSEIALGWSTYNGDHMSMYGVNCGVPKTLIRYLVRWVADHSPRKLRSLLESILDTPISPELLPNRKDAPINQKTEDLLGPYELHDFFLYHLVRHGASPEKILVLAEIAFKGIHGPEQIRKTLRIFLDRFFRQQFKRSCIPDGPKVGTVSLSPRADWRMPSDASGAPWDPGPGKT